MSDFSKTLKDKLKDGKLKQRKLHERGVSGLEVCSGLTVVVDEVLLDLFKSEHGAFDGALVALGGYGRGLLNPCSDIDLLFLIKDSIRKTTFKPPDALLAKLWDLGLKVGHSSRSTSDAISIGLKDLTARTAMMECRFLAGDREYYDLFRKKYFREVVRSKTKKFIKDKVEEMKRRHRAHGTVVCLTEPNLKESAGGLRDIHTATWVIRSRIDVETLEQMAERGMINLREMQSVKEAYSYILRLRNSIHWLTNKLEDTLAQELQYDVAEMEGISGNRNVACATLMQKYYTSASIVERFSEEIIEMSFNYRRRWSWRPILADNDGLYTDGIQLFARSFPPMEYESERTILFRIARRLSDEGLKPAPNLFRGLEKVAENSPASWYRGKRGGNALMEILNLSNSHLAISVFHKTGILSRFIPEFKEITFLSQFDKFHRYSVDEHTIAALRALEGLQESELVAPELRSLYSSISDIGAVKLALLLHDLGKRANDMHAIEEDKITEKIMKRLSLHSIADVVIFLVSEHLLMSVTALRRNISIPTTLRMFCKKIKHSRNLKRLYLLTFADISAVGPDIWSQWKDQLLLSLFQKSITYFIEGEAVFNTGPERVDIITQATLEQEVGVEEAEVRSFLRRAPNIYIRTASAKDVGEHLRLLRRLKGRRLAFLFKLNPGDKTGVFTLASKERIGFFSVVAGAFTAKNLNIIETSINTFDGHMAMDTIVVNGANIGIFLEDAILTKFEEEMADFLEGKRSVAEQVKQRMRYVKTKKSHHDAGRKAQIVMLNNLSEKRTVVEIRAPDRLGLLYDITSIMANLKLNITSAKISTEGGTGINAFYITDANGKKITDLSLQESMIAALKETS